MRTMLLAVAAAAVAATAAAHHSYGATYDLNKSVTLEGKLVQFVYRNPHSFVTLQAPDPSGTMQRWAVEWSGTGQLGGQGVTRETLRAGDQITIVGRPSRVAGEFRLLMVSLKRPSDGFSWGRGARWWTSQW
jgi:DNA/RNA endonuclease YhcR with UshA esterase domain